MVSFAGLDLATLEWVKSKGSNGKDGFTSSGDGECVRVARVGDLVLVDDSKSPSPNGGGVLMFDSEQFSSFLRYVAQASALRP